MTGSTFGFTTEQLEALVEVMFVAAMGDDELSRPERRQLTDFALSLSGGALQPADVAGLLAKAATVLQAEGAEARLAHVAATLVGDSARSLAFGLALAVASADGLGPEKKAVLDSIGRALDIDEATQAALHADPLGWLAPSVHAPPSIRQPR
jgi:tellurite resistance protein